MNTELTNCEIELKLFLSPQDIPNLELFFEQLALPKQETKQQLENTYFDTPELILQQHKIGLRVRSGENFREQTIKTSGQVVGGIHSRPEYNVEITSSFPTLSLFPLNIWPESFKPVQIQDNLQVLFKTDFHRHCWLISQSTSQIEVALDTGTIHAGEKQTPICELEFELKKGEVKDVLELAQQVAKKIPLRLGKASKAQRGYQLFLNASSVPFPALDYIELSKEANVKSALTLILSVGLERWQQLESLIYECEDLITQVEYWERLRTCIRLLRLTLTQFKINYGDVNLDWLEQKLTVITEATYLAKLLQDKSLLGKVTSAEEIKAQAYAALTGLNLTGMLSQLWQEPRYGQVQLAIVEVLFDITSGKRALTHNCLKTLSDKLQEDSWQQLLGHMPSALTEKDYFNLAPLLNDGILVGFTYGNLYSEKKRNQFRLSWQDLSQGITTLGAYRCAEKLVPEAIPFLQSRQKSLIFAMEQSRKAAILKPPYW